MKQTKRLVILAGASLATLGGSAAVPAQTFIGGQRPECAVETSIGDAHPTTKTGYIDEISNVARTGEDFRRVLYTGSMQLVIMALGPGEDIGPATRMGHDTFVRIETGARRIRVRDGTCSSG